MTAYFAYGSNLDAAQMQERVGCSTQATPAQLVGYKLVFDKFSLNRKCGVANLRYTGFETDIVEGAVYQLNAEQLTMLDRFEGYNPSKPSRFGYQRQNVTLRDGSIAESYIVPHTYLSLPLSPSVPYLQHLLKGINAFTPDYYGALFRLKVKEGGQLRDHLPQEYLEHCIECGKQIGILYALEKKASLTTEMINLIHSENYQKDNPRAVAALQPYLEAKPQAVASF
ncbi:gamma-glutamylcyclotransferase [Candidatus Berkiella aquae]|uniref:Gamma-glutamylcyclotransferase n=1 Tax=Candidatus Berkiella aquae TaxID=295108 RepID=A0A0Q9YEM5_9GAMM|nr:gamma-glutamylcyclotransferase family protein [Candidatus Berkiella aquae]MCS5711633.1 gamma-glutamylcyclotransferase [Candidatus Berkiella aquae]